MAAGAAADYRGFFAQAYDGVARFAALLEAEGPVRGLIGPREIERLWERHLVNCGAVAGLVPAGASVIDIGSGAGLPGIVVALMRRDVKVELVDSMLRRTVWLEEAVAALELGNAAVTRARAEELAGRRQAGAVLSRAVGSLDHLARWCGPLLAPGGVFLALKGQGAQEELEASRAALERRRLVAAAVVELAPVAGVEATYVVRATKAAK
ncbi:MAG: 16S rRNA (guanine(527)-N(7))-methyltransferase RsmG [Bifidobacteriaceae bacterium]|jgi:16S rRNA (guanine527-N7)-methyltransferase|nr:16S rRNA (guanine(527)-N(7))-methyltransferase RsmG [Bifidobacteriaceae bacterium]